MDENNEQTTTGGESATESDSQTATVEMTDYSDQLTLVIQQQQVSIGVSCVLCGLLLVSIIFNILKRYI